MRSFLLMKCIDPDDTAQYGCHVTSDDVIRSAEFSITVQGKVFEVDVWRPEACVA